MATLIDIERQALELAEGQRASLAARLLGSLPAVLSDEDHGVAEAMRRDAELDHDPAAAMTFAELKEGIKK